ncbi:MAG: tetratricopeptide repeat protein [Anaerolineales bacterium]|nr:tetratricopeptide repeat protein [Anaerolineales bacterium]
MPDTAFDTLLSQADAAARAGRWPETAAALRQAVALQPDHTGVLTGLGTCLLQMEQPAEAVAYFRQVAGLAPAVAEAHNNLGVALVCQGQPEAAEAAYHQALACDQKHAPAWKNLALLYLQQGRYAEGVPILVQQVQADPADVESLLLLADCYEKGEDPDSARTLYQRVLTLQPGHAEAQAALERLTPAPEPAPRRIARPEHAKKLAALKSLRRPESAPVAESPAAAPALAVAFYGAGEVSDGVRLTVPARALAAGGARVKVGRALAAEDLAQHDVFVFSRPQLSEALFSGLAAARQAGKRVVVDLDDDFHHLPADHPGYPHVGPGNPASLQRLEAALAQADLLIVATPGLAERYGPLARRVAVIPNGWGQANPLWDKPAPPRTTVNIGWAGTATHREDVLPLRNELVRLAREHSQVQIVIGGDPRLYEAFAALPEKRRLFLPMVPFDDYPFLLAHFDILLAPLRANAFNDAKSDIKLLEAGIRRIPWVASPRPAYQAWGVGGLWAEKPAEWYAALQQLVGDPDRRRALGQAGRQQAETREAAVIAGAWQAHLVELLGHPAPLAAGAA